MLRQYGKIVPKTGVPPKSYGTILPYEKRRLRHVFLCKSGFIDV